MPRCSIIIPVFNQAALTRRCLDSVLEHACDDDEVIVVDDGSYDLTQRVLEGYRERIVVVRHSANAGFALACNAGAQRATSDRLVFLNNDTVGTAGWLDALLAHAIEHPSAAVVGAKLLNPDNSIQHAGVVIGADRIPYHIYREFPSDHPAVNVSRRFRVVTAACAYVERPVFERLGGFDAAFVNGYEDVDLCLRAGDAGHEVRYCHESVLFHFESITRRPSDQPFSERIYLQRWGEQVQPDDLQYYLEDGLIELRYRGFAPLEMSISPLVGRAVTANSSNVTEVLLDRRAHEVAQLRAENDRLQRTLRERTPPRFGYSASGAFELIDEEHSTPSGNGDEPPSAAYARARVAPLRLDISPREPRRINLLLPRLDLTSFCGEYAASLELTALLSAAGERVRIVTLDGSPNISAAGRREIGEYGGVIESLDRLEIADRSDRSQPLVVSSADAFIASNWCSAHVAHAAAGELREEGFVYLIQDYEPLAFAMGSLAALARESYDLPHLAVFSSDPLRDWFTTQRVGVYADGKEAGDARSVTFQPPILDPRELAPESIAGRSPRRVLFHARSDEARYLFELGLLALGSAVAEGCFGPAWEFTAIGGDAPRSYHLAEGRYLQVLPRQPPRRYRAVLHAHDVGLALMYTPHPGLVPIEMAAAGMSTVTNVFSTKTEAVLSAISPNLIACQPTVESVGRALRQAAGRAEDVDARMDGARLSWNRSRSGMFDEHAISSIRGTLRC